MLYFLLPERAKQRFLQRDFSLPQPTEGDHVQNNNDTTTNNNNNAVAGPSGADAAGGEPRTAAAAHDDQRKAEEEDEDIGLDLRPSVSLGGRSGSSGEAEEDRRRDGGQFGGGAGRVRADAENDDPEVMIMTMYRNAGDPEGDLEEDEAQADEPDYLDVDS